VALHYGRAGRRFRGVTILCLAATGPTSVFVASNPHSSFFYLFTGAHAIHVLGGLGALAYLLLRTRRKRDTVEGELKRVGAVDAATTYWHFLDGLWICLFLLFVLLEVSLWHRLLVCVAVFET